MATTLPYGDEFVGKWTEKMVKDSLRAGMYTPGTISPGSGTITAGGYGWTAYPMVSGTFSYAGLASIVDNGIVYQHEAAPLPRLSASELVAAADGLLSCIRHQRV